MFSHCLCIMAISYGPCNQKSNLFLLGNNCPHHTRNKPDAKLSKTMISLIIRTCMPREKVTCLSTPRTSRKYLHGQMVTNSAIHSLARPSWSFTPFRMGCKIHTGRLVFLRQRTELRGEGGHVHCHCRNGGQE